MQAPPRLRRTTLTGRGQQTVGNKPSWQMHVAWASSGFHAHVRNGPVKLVMAPKG